MLDRLLGREELKARIDELEEENRHLQRQLDAESERRAEAVTARQDAEERINRLEDEIAGLEGRLGADGTEGNGNGDGVSPRRREELRGDRLAAVLDRIESVRTDREGALSAVVDGAVPDPVTDLAGERAGLVSRTAPCLYYGDDAGAVSVALVPPLPPEEFVEWGDRFRVDRSWFDPAAVGAHALALVRADTFALGRFEGRERVEVEGFESDVKSDHSKGGFSQGRFERLRDEQIEAHVERCHEALADVDDVPLFVVGDRALLAAFADRAAVTRAVDATGDPEAALGDATRSFWTTRLVAV